MEGLEHKQEGFGVVFNIFGLGDDIEFALREENSKWSKRNGDVQEVQHNI